MLTPDFKHDELCQSLWEAMAEFRAGDRFFSVRHIMQTYGVSQSTATKAINRFRREGLLEKKSNLGFIVSTAFEACALTEDPPLLLLVPDWPSSEKVLLEALVEEARQSGEFGTILVHEYTTRDGIPDRLPLIGSGAAGVIVIPASGVSLVEGLQMESYEVPLIVQGCDLTGLGLCSVAVDNHLAGNMAAHYMQKAGHRHIVVVISEPHNSAIMDRTHGVLNYLSLQERVTCSVLDCEVRSGEMATEKTYNRFAAALDNGFDATAIICVSGESAQGILSACANHGMRVPEDLSVLAIASDALTGTYAPPLTTIAVHFDEQLKTAMRLLREKASGIADGLFYPISPSIIERNSVA